MSTDTIRRLADQMNRGAMSTSAVVATMKLLDNDPSVANFNKASFLRRALAAQWFATVEARNEFVRANS